MRKTLLSLLAASTIVFSGCSNQETPVALAAQEQILLTANDYEPETLDPQIAPGFGEYNIDIALFEGLIVPNPQDLSPQPGAAESWSVSEDGRTYTFKLRQNAMWSNGDPVTAHDFAFSYERALSPKLAAPFANTFYPIKGAEAFNKGETQDFSTVGIQALDDHTLQITLTNPTPYFLTLASHWSWFPVHKETILKHGEMDERISEWSKPGNIVTNGPFILKDWEMGKIIKVSKNENYWNEEAVKLKEVHFYPIPESHTQARAFEAGQVHVTTALPIEKYEQLKSENSPYLSVAPGLGTYCYAFNTQKAPFNDVRVREAFNLVIDRDTLVTKVVGGGKLPAKHFTPPNTAGYTTSASVDYKIQRAKELLAEAGFPEGAGFPEVSLLYNTSENHRIIAEAVQGMWKEHLGVDVSLENQEWKVFLGSRRAKDFDIVRGNWMGDYPDPNTFLDVYVSESTNNHAGWKNAEYDKLIALAAKELDLEKRKSLFNQAENILMQEHVLAPIYFFNGVNLVHTSLRNWYPNMMSAYPYQNVYIEAGS